ncbi:hypothetical protein [Dyadobacter alkalitolerans]|uniref:hypothetical protein n=1 Tax=Dyadobacter alkalitolerans TaxID=492736 RepID=UPI0003FF94AB|nr:hypothetical protein [Dyadobacter alkalitolerans]
MNKLLNKITVLSGVACGLIFISCQKEEFVPAVESAAGNAAIVQAPPVMIPASRLVKFNNDTIIYNADGSTKKVIETLENRIYRTEYKYAPNSVKAIRYRNGKAYLTMDWKLSNGRATSLTYKNFETGGIYGASTSTVEYHYNNKNQLTKLVAFTGSKTTVTLTYDNMGNVFKLLYVDNTPDGDKFMELVNYEYTEYVGGPTQLAKGSTINLHVFNNIALGWMGDAYLPIFGNFGKSLVKKVTATSLASPTKFAYALDASGYVKEMKELNQQGNFISSTQLIFAPPAKDRSEDYIVIK